MKKGSGLRHVEEFLKSILQPRALSSRQSLTKREIATSAIQKEEAQIGAVEWTKNLVNCVSLTGYLANRLTLNAALRSPLAKGSLKVLTGRNKPPMFVDLEIWGDLAHVAANNLMQGDQIQVVGKLKKNTWTTREGAERRDVSISLTNINRIVDGMASQDFAGQGVPWDAVPQDAENYDQSRGTDFEEDQTQGLSGWGNEQPSYASSAPAQRNGQSGDAWVDLADNPDQYEDFRQEKQMGNRGPRFPDFKHRTTGKALWLDSAPRWVKDSMQSSNI